MSLVVSEKVVVENAYYRVPWVPGRSPVEAGEAVAISTLFVMNGLRSLPPFIRETRKVLKQLRDAPGLIGYTIQARSIRGPFWTLSAWSDQANMRVFIESGAHQHATIAVARHMERFATSSWLISQEDLPPSWSRALKECPE